MEFLILHLLIAGVASLDMSSRDQLMEKTCEELRAKGAAPTPAYSTNMRVLMDSWNYQNLLPPRMGAVWDQVDNDMNNDLELTTNVSFIWYKLSIIIVYHIYSGFKLQTLYVNNLSKYVGSMLVHRTTG